ncbi:hypothetical protein OCU04_011671 [Sclerotinia nivalis]|uniref:Uncharacterized protein n=1 Tax=Sclerotinia nivalis TaxID=352851 RepID=A0A9X0DFT0_9HELO|nr:hypothetical protein OCU04_011671 [Sclerotinia nivalis]
MDFFHNFKLRNSKLAIHNLPSEKALAAISFYIILLQTTNYTDTVSSNLSVSNIPSLAPILKSFATDKVIDLSSDEILKIFMKGLCRDFEEIDRIVRDIFMTTSKESTCIIVIKIPWLV